jgi:phage gp46-like protein
MSFIGDISLAWDSVTQTADWSFQSGDLTTGNDLATAVIVSLFSDRRAPPDYVPIDASNYRGGWWGDQYQASPIGSRLWMLARAKYTSAAQITKLAKGYCDEALAWMISDGVAQSVTVTADLLSPGVLAISINIVQPRQQAGKVFRFSLLWAQALAN